MAPLRRYSPISTIFPAIIPARLSIMGFLTIYIKSRPKRTLKNTLMLNIKTASYPKEQKNVISHFPRAIVLKFIANIIIA